MNSSEAALDFMVLLAKARAMFRNIHLYAEKIPALHSVTTLVIPFKGEPSDYADRGVTLSIALNAEIVKPRNPEQKAIGISLLLRHSQGYWIAEAEIGWTGEKIGWDSFDSRETKSGTIEEISILALPLIEWLESRFKDESANLD